MPRSLDVAWWLSLFFGVLAAAATLHALYALSPWGRHAPWYQLDALIWHFTYAGPLLVLSWLAFIPSKRKRALLIPALIWTAIFLLPLVLVLISELMPRRPRTGPDLEHSANHATSPFG